jgi:cell division protein FtsW
MDTLLQKLKGDKYLWLIVLGLSAFSLLAVYSSTGTLAFQQRGGNTEYYLLKHGLLLLFGMGIMYVSSLAHYKVFARVATILLVVSIPLLIYTLFWGSDINDAARWITIPVIDLTFQTSDLAKLALILYTAKILSQNQHRISQFKQAFVPVVLPIIVVCALIAPADLSSAVVLFFSCLLILFVGRVGLLHVGALVGSAALILAIIGLFLFSVPEENLPGRMSTWKHRVEAFSGGEDIEQPYQVEQALIAVAKGKLVGLGPGNSNQRNFVPHPYSDFIYAIILEEYGLIGGAILMLLYIAFLYRCTRIVIRAHNPFGALLAVGFGFSLSIQAFVNMGVAVNLLPVTGLTLPLVSMGGTSMLFTSLAIGIILSASRDLGMGYEAEYQEEPEPEHKNVEVALG